MARKSSCSMAVLMVLSLLLCFGSAVQAANCGKMGSGCTGMTSQTCTTCTCTNCTCTDCTCSKSGNTASLKTTGKLNIGLSPALLTLINKMPGLRTALQSLLLITAPQTLLAGDDVVTATGNGSGSCSMGGSGSCSMGGSGSCSMGGSGSCSMGGSGSCSMGGSCTKK
jgi:hypothetical protein